MNQTPSNPPPSGNQPAFPAKEKQTHPDPDNPNDLGRDDPPPTPPEDPAAPPKPHPDVYPGPAEETNRVPDRGQSQKDDPPAEGDSAVDLQNWKPADEGGDVADYGTQSSGG